MSEPGPFEGIAITLMVTTWPILICVIVALGWQVAFVGCP